MRYLFVELYDTIFTNIERLFSGWLLGLAARLIFASVALMYFWSSALNKICAKDWTAPGQPEICNPFSPTIGAYAQILPQRFEATAGDISQMSFFDHLIVFVGTYSEFVLPVLVIVGLLGRLASFAMIVFVAVMTAVDINGHKVGWDGFFDRQITDQIADLRLLILFLLLYLFLRGPGPISVDGLLRRSLGKS